MLLKNRFVSVTASASALFLIAAFAANKRAETLALAKPSEEAGRPRNEGGRDAPEGDRKRPAPLPRQGSTFAPAEDLAYQVDQYIKDLETITATEDEYKDAIGETNNRVANDANTMAVIALALGLHDQDNRTRPPPPRSSRPPGQLAATKDYESAKKGVARLKEVIAGKGDPAAN